MKWARQTQWLLAFCNLIFCCSEKGEATNECSDPKGGMNNVRFKRFDECINEPSI